MSQAVNSISRSAFSPIASPDLPEEALPLASDSLSPAATTVTSPVSPSGFVMDRSISVSPDFEETNLLKPLSLLEAAAKGQATLVAALLDKKANINEQDAEGNTALHLAASCVNGKDTVSLLLHRGAYPKANKARLIACDLSKQKGLSEIVEIFRKSVQCEFWPSEIKLAPPSTVSIEKRRSPLDGRVMVFCRDSASQIVKTYKHAAYKGELPKGAFKVCKPSVEDGIADAVRLVIRTKGCSEEGRQMIRRNLEKLIFFHEKVGKERGIASLDLIVLNKSIREADSESIDLYQKRYNLGDLINVSIKHTKLSEIQKLQIVRDLLWGVYAIHKNGIAHCDIKPANILINKKEDGRLEAALTDFDLCAVSNIEANQDGTPFYIAPEVAHYGLINRRKLGVKLRQIADIWALGIVLYQIAKNWESPTIYGYEYIGINKPMEYWLRLQELYITGLDCLVFVEPAKDSLLHIAWQMLRYRSSKRITIEEALRQFETLYPEFPATSSAAAAAAAGGSSVASDAVGDPSVCPSTPMASEDKAESPEKPA